MVSKNKVINDQRDAFQVRPMIIIQLRSNEVYVLNKLTPLGRPYTQVVS